MGFIVGFVLGVMAMYVGIVVMAKLGIKPPLPPGTN